MTKFNDDTPASEFPEVWRGGGNDDELSGILEKVVNKHICLYLANIAAEKHAGVAGFDDGRATIVFVMEDDEQFHVRFDVEELFVDSDELGFIQEEDESALADTFQRLADLFRKKAEDRS